MLNSNKKPLKLEDLQIYYNQDEQGYNARQKLLLKHNALFYQTIMNTIAAKNKADFPLSGPTSENNLEFQNEKLKILLYAIIEKKTSPSGHELKYPLSQFGVGQAALSGARTVASKIMGVGRAMTGKRQSNKKSHESNQSQQSQELHQTNQSQESQSSQESHQYQKHLETNHLLKKGGKKDINSFKKPELLKIAKKYKINIKNKNGNTKTKKELYESLKIKKLI
jgi:hypothetical protein